jgi:hypothetical protein
LQAFCQLLEEKGAFEAHLHDGPVETGFALAGGVVGFFDFVESALQLDAFAVVGLFYRRCERCVLRCVWSLVSILSRLELCRGGAPGGAMSVV